MPSLVVDCSVAAAWCFPDEQTDYTNAVLKALRTPLEAAVPQIWAYELRNSVLMGVRRRRITPLDASNFLESIRKLRIQIAEPVSFDSIFELALRHRLTYYDAAYLDLALREALPLASLDEALCNSARESAVALFRP